MTELFYAVNEDGIQAYCPFDNEASCGNWCPMLGHEGGRWFCTLSVNRAGCGQRLMLVSRSQLPDNSRTVIQDELFRICEDIY